VPHRGVSTGIGVRTCFFIDEFILRTKKSLDIGTVKGDLYFEKDKSRELQLA